MNATQISVVTPDNLDEKLSEIIGVFNGTKTLIFRWVFETDFEKACRLFRNDHRGPAVTDKNGNLIMSIRHEYGIHSISRLDEEGKAHESIIFVNVRGNKSVIEIGDQIIIGPNAIYIKRCTESRLYYWEVWALNC